MAPTDERQSEGATSYPTWDVLPNPAIRELAPYSPAPTDRPDPVELVGGPDSPGRRFRGYGWILFLGIPMALLVAAAASDVSVPVIFAAGIALLIAFVARVVYIAVRVPRWTRPQVSVNGESFAVTDVTGTRRTAAWADIGAIYVTSVSEGLTDELRMRWIEAASDVEVTACLGDTLDFGAVCEALSAHAPQGLEVQGGPQRAVAPTE